MKSAYLRSVTSGFIGLLLLALSACGEVDGGSNTTAAEIREQEAIWSAAVVDDYDMEYKVRCLCPTKDRFVMVREGRIERVDYKAIVTSSHDYDPFDYYHEDYVYTVERLFDIVRDAHQFAYAVNVTWDETLGFPAELRIDWNHNGLDDEYQILVTSFVRP